MRIALVAPPWIAIPPVGYGGTERVVHQLAEGLTARGHEVTLFASGDSRTTARLRSLFPWHLAEHMGSTAYEARHIAFALSEIASGAEPFDVVHDHSGYQFVAFAPQILKCPMLHTLHGPFDVTNRGFYEQFKHAMAFNAISEDQRSQGPPDMNWVGVVHNAIDVEPRPFRAQSGDYLLALGRICEQKGFHLAIEIARRTGRRLVMAGALQTVNERYYREQVEPFLDGEQISYLGEVDEARAQELFAGAAAFLFPIIWPEPFGIVMIEALAAGTPVIALRNGSVPEVIQHGVTGFVCDDVDEMVAAVRRISEIDRATCRRVAEERFTTDRLVDGYEALYRRLAG